MRKVNKKVKAALLASYLLVAGILTVGAVAGPASSWISGMPVGVEISGMPVGVELAD